MYSLLFRLHFLLYLQLHAGSPVVLPGLPRCFSQSAAVQSNTADMCPALPLSSVPAFHWQLFQAWCQADGPWSAGHPSPPPPDRHQNQSEIHPPGYEGPVLWPPAIHRAPYNPFPAKTAVTSCSRRRFPHSYPDSNREIPLHHQTAVRWYAIIFQRFQIAAGTLSGKLFSRNMTDPGMSFFSEDTRPPDSLPSRCQQP